MAPYRITNPEETQKTKVDNGTMGMWWGRWDLNPGSHAPQACILVQARRRPQSTKLGHIQGEITNTLIKLKASGLADSTVKNTSAFYEGGGFSARELRYSY